MTNPMFFYGTLRDPGLRQVVTGLPADPAAERPARLPGYRAETVLGERYPVLRPDPAAQVDGVVVSGLGPAALARIAFWEEAGGYSLTEAVVETEAGPLPVQVWQDGGGTATSGPWDHALWAARDASAARAAAEEFMAAFGAAPDRLARLWPGMKIRAEARAAAAAEAPVQKVRAGFTRADVAHEGTDRPYTAFFAVEEHRLRFRRFGGGWSEPVMRAAFVSGDAVTVLPYDPVTDRVLLVEQWRAGPWARGDRAPWTLEVVAGRRDAGEPAEATARREAVEEAGLTLGRIEPIAAYYPSPGILAEFITSFVGEADLSAAGGLHGLDGEQEDIRALVLPFAEAFAAIGSGELNNAPAILSLLWLARERDRLRRDWARG